MPNIIQLAEQFRADLIAQDSAAIGEMAKRYQYGLLVLRGAGMVFVVIGASMSLGPVIDFSDAMIFAMAFPNILGMYFLLPVVKKELDEYWSDYQQGRLKKFGKAINRG